MPTVRNYQKKITNLNSTTDFYMKFEEIKWDFPVQNVNNHGSSVIDLASQTFNFDRFESIARESIQNSLDAYKSPDIPVKVRIKFDLIDLTKNKDMYNNFFSSIEEHMKLCKNYYTKKNQDAVSKVFSEMLLTLARFKKLEYLPFLEISDYSTIGMYFDKDNPNDCRMATFMHTDGTNFSDSKSGGGANGIGKMAYFGMSPFKMVLASTFAVPNRGDNAQSGKSFLAGSVKFATHNKPDDATKQYQYAGYFPPIPDDVPYLPWEGNIDHLPFRFRRKSQINADPELGTTFFIIGCEPFVSKDDLKKVKNISTREKYEPMFWDKVGKLYANRLLPAILRNYFASIQRGKLEVEIGSTVFRENKIIQDPIIINKNTIKGLIEKTFPETDFKNSKIKSLNPRPFYFSLTTPATDASSEDEIRFYQEEIDLDSQEELKGLCPEGMKWGKAKLYLNINPEFKTSTIIAMRAPLMSVYKFPIKMDRGRYAGVLICDEEENYANQLLRASEPATHDKWDAPTAASPGHGESEENAQALIDLLNKWITGILEEIFPNNTQSDIYEGMREFLPVYNPEDASQRNAELNKGILVYEGERSIIKIGKKNQKGPRGIKVTQRELQNGQDDDNGEWYTGGQGGSGCGTGPGYSEPKRKVKEDGTSNTKINMVRNVPMRVRSFAEKTTSGWIHTVILSGAQQDFEHIDLELNTQGENRSKEPLQISWAKLDDKKLRVNGSKIMGIPVQKGSSVKLKIQFKLDNRPFSLRVLSTIEAQQSNNQK